jgi:hypothetical protein
MSYLGRTVGCPTCREDEELAPASYGPLHWDDLNEVPHDVIVEDKDGDRYHWTYGLGWFWTGMERILDSTDMTITTHFGPFTEVSE